MNLELLTKTGHIRRDFIEEEFEEIKRLTPHVKDGTRKSLRERVFSIINHIEAVPRCIICGDECHFLKNGTYSKHCSQKCQYEDKTRSEKMKETKKLIYGDENYVNIEKREQTCLEKYGCETPFKNDDVKDKIKHTCKEKYGAEFHSQSNNFKSKTSIKKAKHFQNRRNEDATDYSGVVYILEFTELKLIKIGLTHDFEKRSKGLISDFGEYEVIKIIETVSCFSLERELHESIDEYRICLNEGVGRTEFFDIRCKKKLQEMI